jgi:hypothetical protein
MSALGQKQTCRNVQPMSALPPKADIGTQPSEPAKCQKRTFSAIQLLRRLSRALRHEQKLSRSTITMPFVCLANPIVKDLRFLPHHDGDTRLPHRQQS